ncbi:MAG: hypothetical protein GTN80_09055 [Nitrososphaeria archaeon]|nr:hypothetical protein [Nitrososphaeria archaeon]NIN53314.1 hypothetical protein [Nitrososphaeria archaeon]NIQ33767.1 hypothetical protein [Nitrososphaeria archaeon]
MSEKEKIEKLRDMALRSTQLSVRMEIIGKLETYGEKALSAITDIVDVSRSTRVRRHGRNSIMRIKEKSKPPCAEI